MATKNQHVQDAAVVERRLRPIYDWLDVGNNKKALQECEKVLKKTPNLACAKALKALTLLRLGKNDEFRTIVDALAAENPSEDVTLQTLSLCYRESQQMENICKLYESAVKKDPTNEELLSHLFMSYVRISEFKLQHQTAMQLYKVKSCNPYYCWAVMSLVSQATRGEGLKDAKKRSLFLSLAERMLDKQITSEKMDSEQQIQLYIMILELQNKFEEALKVLEGPMSEKLTCLNIPQYKLSYLIKLKKWGDVNLLCKSVLFERVDRWDIWKEYINSVMELLKNDNKTDNHLEISPEIELNSIDNTIEKAHEFICKIVEHGTESGYQLRGPYLARFELCSRLLQNKINPNDLVGDLSELFVEFFRKFGHKPCCVSDLRLYFNLLTADQKSDLSQRFLKDVGISSTNIPQNEHQMLRHICSLQLCRLLGGHRNLSHEHSRALVAAFTLHYEHGYQNYGSNLLVTDFGPSDPYALLAAHILYDLAQERKKAEPILVALVLLEKVLKNSPSNFHVKLLCIRLYHSLGGILGAITMYNSLDVKHLQLDSLGFLHCAQLANSGHFSEASNLFNVTLKFFASNYKDSSDHLSSAYKFGSFAQLGDFMNFREKMNNSLHYTTTAVDRIFITLIQCTNLDALYNMDISPKDDKIDWELLVDNSDWNVYVGWDPERIDGPIDKSPEIANFVGQNIKFLKLRTQILWAMSSSVNILKSNDGIKNKHIQGLKAILNDWEALENEIKAKNYQPIRQNEVVLPLPSRLHSILESPVLPILANLFKILAHFSEEKSLNENENFVTDLTKIIEINVKSLVTKLENVTNVCNNFYSLRISMEYIVSNIEVISIATLVCCLINELLRPVQAKKGKKRPELKPREQLLDLTRVLKNELPKIENILQNWKIIDSLDEICENLEYLQLNNNEIKQTVQQNIVNSHSNAVKELRNVLKTKSKMLNCI